MLVEFSIGYKAEVEPSLTSKMLKKMALIIVTLLVLQLPRRHRSVVAT